MKFKTRDGPVLLLLMFLMAACGTAPTPSASDVAFSQTQQAMYVCATAQALNMPDPCQPTPTSTPIPPSPTATATQVTGWVYLEPGGGSTPMPYGFEPNCNDNPVGCPGEAYRYMVNGTAVPKEQGGYQATPWYKPYLLFGIPLLIVVLGLGYFYAYQSTAPDRAAAQVMIDMGKAFAGPQMKSLQAPTADGNTSLARRASRERVKDQALTRKQLGGYLDAFAQEHPVPEAFVIEVSTELNRIPEDQLIPILAIQRLLKRCDSHHGTGITVLFGQFLIRKYQEERIG